MRYIVLVAVFFIMLVFSSCSELYVKDTIPREVDKISLEMSVSQLSKIYPLIEIEDPNLPDIKKISPELALSHASMNNSLSTTFYKIKDQLPTGVENIYVTFDKEVLFDITLLYASNEPWKDFVQGIINEYGEPRQVLHKVFYLWTDKRTALEVSKSSLNNKISYKVTYADLDIRYNLEEKQRAWMKENSK